MEFPRIFAEANAAGELAAAEATPRPMIVTRHANPLDDGSPIVESEVVPAGVIGFAWITIPSTDPGAEYARLAAGGTINTSGDIMIYVDQFGQSLARKVAYANAYAESLTRRGIAAGVGSRQD